MPDEEFLDIQVPFSALRADVVFLGSEQAGLESIAQVCLENELEMFPDLIAFHFEQELDPPVEVPGHPVRGGEEYPVITIVIEQAYAGMLEEPADHAVHFYRLA
jgi:hypothetical protein